MLRLGMGIWPGRRGEVRVSIMPSDVAMLPVGVRAISIGVANGQRIDVQVTRVMATGTKATQIEAVL